MTIANVSAVSADVLGALHRLNGHARAYGSGKRAIYRYKTLVAALLVVQGEASAQLVQWTGTCGHCGGTGRYVDSCGERFPHCRQCSSTGTVTLKFVETMLPDGVEWHHPWTQDQGGVEIADLAGLARWQSNEPRGWRDAKGSEPIFWNVASNWQPRQPADRLLSDDAAAAMNVVEAWVLASVLPPSSTLHWMRERALREMRGYVLDLGRVGLRCWYCQSPEISIGLGRPGPPLFMVSGRLSRAFARGPCALAKRASRGGGHATARRVEAAARAARIRPRNDLRVDVR